HLVNVFHEMEDKPFKVVLFNFVYVTFVAFAEDDLTNTTALRSENLFLDPPHRQNLSTPRDLTCHCDTRSYFTLGVDRSKGSKNRNTRRRTVSWNSARRHVNVQVILLENAVIDTKTFCVRLEIRQCGHGRFLHHVAELTGKCKGAFATTQTGFNEQYFATNLRPCKTGNNTGHFIALIKFFIENLSTKNFPHCFLADSFFKRLFHRHRLGSVSYQRGNFSFQVTHT